MPGASSVNNMSLIELAPEQGRESLCGRIQGELALLFRFFCLDLRPWIRPKALDHNGTRRSKCPYQRGQPTDWRFWFLSLICGLLCDPPGDPKCFIPTLELSH